MPLPENRRWFHVLGLLIPTLCVIRPLPALSHDPFLGWQTVSSAHFDVHFHQGLESLAPETAAICERRFGELAARFHFQPDSRIQVVLADETDEANGAATALPYDTVYLIVAPPDEQEQVYDVDAWLDYVVSHELTHVFHLDHATGFPRFLRRIFGRIPWTTPNYYQPDWAMEGLATSAETDLARAVGRGQSPFFRGMMRLELEAGLKSVRKVNLPLRTWPGGTTSYLYGVYFMRFLKDRYGDDSLRLWVENYSDDWIPYFINRNARKTFGKKLPALWRDFGAWLQQNLGPEIQAIKDQGLHGQPAAVAPGGGDYWGPYKAGYAVRRDGYTRPRLQKLDQGRWTDVGEAYVAEFWPGLSRILYTEDEVVRQADVTRDLWEMDPRTGDSRRLTSGLRVQEAVETAAGVLAVVGERGQKQLVRLDQGRVAEVLWRGRQEENVASLCPSPDGARVAASRWRRGRGWDVEEFDLAEGCWLPVASRPESEIHPSYSADGRWLFFSAAYGGTFNIYALERASGALRRITNVVGGAFHPWPGPGTKIYFSLLTARGYVLGETDLDPALAVPSPAPDASAPRLEALALPSLAPARPYSPWPTLWPTSWYPELFSSSAGVFYGVSLFGDDVLDRHHYTLTAYDLENFEDVVGTASYSYTRWIPQVGVLAERSIAREPNGAGTRKHLAERWDVFMDLPWSGTWRSLWLSADAGGTLYSDHGGDAWAPPLTPYYHSNLGVSASYNAASQPRRALGSVDGLQAQAGYYRVDAQNPDGFGWSYWNVGRPTSLFWGLELEDSLQGGHITDGDAIFSLASYWPALAAGQDSRRPNFRTEYSLAGYDWDMPQLEGPSFAAGHVGLRFPLGLVEWGIMAPPVGVERLYGRLWAESGQAYDGGGLGKGRYDSVGGDLNMDLVFFYSAGVGVQFGYARGLDKIGTEHVYLRVRGINISF